MKTVGRTLLYVLLLGIAIFCFGRFRAGFATSDIGVRRFEGAEIGRETPATPTELGAGSTNSATVAGAATNAVSAGAAPGTANPVAGAETIAPALSPSGSPPTSTSGGGAATSTAKGKGKGSTGYLAGFVAALIGLAVLLGWDITQWVATKATRGLGADLKPIEGDPEYDAAEAEWAKGNHLDAINMLRDFLRRNPSQQHAAIRIAEIYEKDLGNFIAAALELEEVLNKRLPREKWGWTAIHLANIYSGRLNQADKALATLDRIVRDYPDTAAARKARQRLGLPEPEEAPSPDHAADVDHPVDAEEPETPGVPKGFRPKKR